MTETGKKTEGQEVRISWLGVGSCGLSMFFLAALIPLFVPADEGGLFVSLAVGPFLAPVTVIMGIAALMQRVSGARSLWWFGIIGIVVPIAWAVVMCLWIAGVAASWH